MDKSAHIGLYVNIASKHIRRELDARFTRYDNLSGLQGRILGDLTQAESANQTFYQKDLEKRYGTRRSSINSVISNMEQKGFLTRVPDPDDARLKKLTLTDRGRQTSHDIFQSMCEFERSLSEEFTPEEKDLLISMLKRIIDHHGDQNTDNRKEGTDA